MQSVQPNIRIVYRWNGHLWTGTVVTSEVIQRILDIDVLAAPDASNPTDLKLFPGLAVNPNLETNRDNSLFRAHVAKICRVLEKNRLDGGSHLEKLVGDKSEKDLCDYCEAVLLVRQRHEKNGHGLSLDLGE